MHILLLFNERKLSLDYYKSLDKYLVGTQGNTSPRPSVTLYIKKDNSGELPCIYFSNETLFLDRIADKGIMELFTTMPDTELSNYYGKTFRSYDKTRAFEMRRAELFDGYDAFEKRIIKIVELTPQAAAIAGEDKVHIEYAEGFGTGFYKCYADPIYIEKTDLAATVFNYVDPGLFPYALPASGDFDGDYDGKSYYNKIDIGIRENIRTTIGANGTSLAKESVVFKILELCELGIYKDFLKEGGYLTIDAVPEESISQQEGITRLGFRYSIAGGKGDIRAWRRKLVELNESDSAEILAIKASIIGDMCLQPECFAPAREVLRTPFSVLRKFSRGTMALTGGNTTWYGLINDFVQSFPPADLEYITKLLSPFAANDGTDSNRYDEISMLRAFGEHFFKCPFADSFEDDWREVIEEFFIRRKGIYTVMDVLSQYHLTAYNGKQDVMDVLCDEPDILFKLRLLLPLNSRITLISSNTLDVQSSSLDNNFILT